MSFLTELFNHYGYIVLFAALALELIAFPTPGETLMTYCGFLVFQGRLNWAISIIVASLGVISGITVSYFIGHTLGASFLRKYGKYVHMGPDKLDKITKWFERYGNGLLVTALFIPGIRHITGYFSGINKMPFKRFALNAYLGAFIWTGTFISLGRILGENWEKFHGAIKKYLVIFGIILALGLICTFIYKNYRSYIKEFIFKSLEKSINMFHSLGKIKAVIVGICTTFIGLFIVMVGLIQDLLADEFSQFDIIVTYLVGAVFPENWLSFMRFVRLSIAPAALTILVLLILAWIMYKGRNRLLEAGFLIITVLGGVLLESALRLIFHRLGPSGLSLAANIKYTFPSEQAFLTVVSYGFAVFMVLRHSKKRRIGTILALLTLVICAAAGLSAIFFYVQYPSDVVAGYVFGGVWLSLNIMLLEIFRVLPEV